MNNKDQNINGLPNVDKKDVPKMPKCKPPKTEIKIKKLTELDPNKIYVLKITKKDVINNDLVDMQKRIRMLYPELELMIISDSFDFVEAPEAAIIDLICKDIAEGGKLRSVIQGLIINEHGHE